jgi:hypothetical protein
VTEFAVDPTAIVAIVVPVCLSIVGGGLAMAWRLGGLERTVKDVKEDVSEVKDDVRELRQIAGFPNRQGHR